MWFEIPGHLENKGGHLYIAGQDATELAQKHGTPLYVYNSGRIRDNYRRFYGAIKKHTDLELRIHFAMKTNSNKEILGVLLKEGSWIDAVSVEEAKRAIEVGFSKEKILFTGTSVNDADLQELVKMGVRINIDSISQLKRLKKFANVAADTRMIGHATVKSNDLGHHAFRKVCR